MPEAQADPLRSELEARIVELEVRVSFQAKTIAELDDVLREFTRRIQQLEGVIEGIGDTVNGMLTSQEEEEEEPPPPHY